MKERYEELDIMKGIGIILVYLGHSFNLCELEWNKEFEYLYGTIYSFHMPLFFFISGLLSNKDKKLELKKFYIGKVKRLLIPYLFINLIDFFSRMMFPKVVNSNFSGLKEVLFYGTKISWFVYTLFIIFMIFPFLDKYILKKDKYYLFGLLLIILNYLKIFENIEIFSLNAIIIFYIYFYLGYIIKPIYSEKIKFKIKKEKKILFILNIIFLFFSYRYFEKTYLTRVIFATLGILIALNVVLRIKENTVVYKFFYFLGINSLTFYLMEGFITVVYRVVLLKIISVDHSYLLVSIFFSLRVLTAYLIVKLIIVKSSILSFLLGASREKNN